MIKSQFILMMVLVASGAAGVTMATDDYAVPSASE